MRYADSPLGLQVNLAGGVSSIVAPDRHQARDSQAVKAVEHVAHFGFVLGRMARRCSQDGAAAKVIGLHFFERQFQAVLNIALNEPLEAVTDSDGFDAMIEGFDSHRADDAVDSWCRTAADQQS